MNFNGNRGNLKFTGFCGVVGLSGDVDSKRKWSLLSITESGLHFSKYINNPTMDLELDGSLKIIGVDLL